MLGVLCVVTVLSVPSPAQAGPVFVTRNGTSFDLAGQQFRFGGTNNYYLHYKSQLMVDDVFNDAVAMNFRVIRAWTSLECGGDRPNSAGGCSQGTDLWMQRWSNTVNNPVYNTGANGLQKLDYMLAKANQLGVKLILPLVNNWRDFGGMDQYVTWYGLQFHDQFYTDARIRGDYRDWVSTLVNRTNTITGVQYKNDPAIFSWELANEPRCINASLPTSGTCTQQTLVDWASEMSTFIKSIDPNHMVSIGDEGFLDWNRPSDWPYNAADGVDHEALTSLPNIDFGTYHVYPDHWGRDVNWVTQWITDHATASANYGKPIILEEFGYQNQSLRDSSYTTWTNTVRTTNQAGWLVWILTGIQDDGQLYPDFDGFRVTFPSANATNLAARAQEINSGGCTDTSPPTTPGQPVASNVTTNSATLTWTPSTDVGCSGLAGYNVYREAGATDPIVGQTTGNSVNLTGLSQSTQYTHYVRARDNAGNLSDPSPPGTFTTSQCVDSTPPTQPGPPTVTNVTPTGATLTWAPSTDSGCSGLAGYTVFRVQGTTTTPLATSATNTVNLTGLTPGTTYQVVVRARDNAGNQSTSSNPVVVFTTPTAGNCSVAYTVVGQWGGAFQGEIKITNTSGTTITGWTLAFSFPNGQVITQMWGGVPTQNGANVTVVPPVDWNRVIGANGGSVTAGFIANWNNVTNNEPSSFTLNGTSCTLV